MRCADFRWSEMKAGLFSVALFFKKILFISLRDGVGGGEKSRGTGTSRFRTERRARHGAGSHDPGMGTRTAINPTEPPGAPRTGVLNCTLFPEVRLNTLRLCTSWLHSFSGDPLFIFSAPFSSGLLIDFLQNQFLGPFFIYSGDRPSPC